MFYIRYDFKMISNFLKEYKGCGDIQNWYTKFIKILTRFRPWNNFLTRCILLMGIFLTKENYSLLRNLRLDFSSNSYKIIFINVLTSFMPRLSAGHRIFDNLRCYVVFVIFRGETNRGKNHNRDEIEIY